MREEINVRQQSKQVASGKKSKYHRKIHSKQNRTYIGKKSEILRHNQNERERDVGSFELGINVRERAFIRALSYLFAQRISSDRKYWSFEWSLCTEVSMHSRSAETWSNWDIFALESRFFFVLIVQTSRWSRKVINNSERQISHHCRRCWPSMGSRI